MADCAIYILVRPTGDGQFEVCMEDRPDLQPGRRHYWVFPGGKVEPGETPEQAMRREAREEVGAEVLLYRRLTKDPLESQAIAGTRSARSPAGWWNYAFVVHLWKMHTENGELPAHTFDHQHAPLRWFSPTEHAGPDDGFTAVHAIARLLVTMPRHLLNVHV